jgi:hypothetical protein
MRLRSRLANGCNGVVVDRYDRACCFLASLGFCLLSLRGYANERTAHEQALRLASGVPISGGK